MAVDGDRDPTVRQRSMGLAAAVCRLTAKLPLESLTGKLKNA
jgi:hypothetical protein